MKISFQAIESNFMTASRYTVLYNPISNEGHLDSWHVLFMDLLVRAGQPVIAVTSDVQGIAEKLAMKGYSVSDKLILVPHGERLASSARARNGIRQAWTLWNTYCDRAIYQRHWILKSETPLSRIALKAKYVGLNLVNKLVEQFHARYRKFRSAEAVTQESQSESRLDPIRFANDINKIIADYPDQIGLVLNMYVDAYQSAPESWANFSLDAGVPWVGLCITPTRKPEQTYYDSNHFLGTFFLDEAVVANYRQVLPSKNFVFLPDITEVALPEKTNELSQAILEFAAGRKIVFMGGSIGKQKNLARWYQLIEKCDARSWFFVQIGRLNKNNMTQDDLISLDRIQRQPPSNLFIWPEFLPDERSFNAIIAISDVIFAVYRDFDRSSNMLAKAAYFEKPLLVADDALMGERVAHYGIGKTVPSDDVNSMQHALESMHDKPNLQLNFKRYRQDFSESVMQQKLIEFIQTCMNIPAQEIKNG